MLVYRCWSYVGKQGGDQKISIGLSGQPFCKYLGVLLHELGHSLGFFHEQTRPDRDSYIQIVWENMIASAHLNFIRYSSYEINSLSIPYDYASIMHYPNNVRNTVCSLCCIFLSTVCIIRITGPRFFLHNQRHTGWVWFGWSFCLTTTQLHQLLDSFCRLRLLPSISKQKEGTGVPTRLR